MKAKDGKTSYVYRCNSATSTSKEAMNNEFRIPGEVIDCVIKYAKNAKEAGLDEFVCLYMKLRRFMVLVGRLLTVTPGIRFGK